MLESIRGATASSCSAPVTPQSLMRAAHRQAVGRDREQEVSVMSRSLKLLTAEIGTPFLVLSQLSRAPELRKGNHRPQLSDLRESGTIEQNADNVAFIFREEMYTKDREDLHGRAELILAKQRNGPV